MATWKVQLDEQHECFWIRARGQIMPLSLAAMDYQMRRQRRDTSRSLPSILDFREARVNVLRYEEGAGLVRHIMRSEACRRIPSVILLAKPSPVFARMVEAVRAAGWPVTMYADGELRVPPRILPLTGDITPVCHEIAALSYLLDRHEPGYARRLARLQRHDLEQLEQLEQLERVWRPGPGPDGSDRPA